MTPERCLWATALRFMKICVTFHLRKTCGECYCERKSHGRTMRSQVGPTKNRIMAVSRHRRCIELDINFKFRSQAQCCSTCLSFKANYSMLIHHATNIMSVYFSYCALKQHLKISDLGDKACETECISLEFTCRDRKDSKVVKGILLYLLTLHFCLEVH